MQHQRLARVAEEAAVARVEIALRRKSSASRMACIEFDAEIIDRSPAFLLTDGFRSLTQLLPVPDQLAVHEASRGPATVAGPSVCGMLSAMAFPCWIRTGATVSGSRMRGQIDAPSADPLDRPRLQLAVRQGEDDVPRNRLSLARSRWRSGMCVPAAKQTLLRKTLGASRTVRLGEHMPGAQRRW